jgi:aspartate 1-decarboxylase
MQRFLMKSKIHGARVTAADLNYVGSVTIDRDLLRATDIWPNEKVLIVNLENGARFETYAFEGAPGSGVIGMNGGCAHLAKPGDRVLLMAFAAMSDEEARRFQPKVVFVDEKNAVDQVLGAPR